MKIKTIAIISALAILTACSGDVKDPAAQFTEAVSAYGENDFAGSIKLLKPIAEQGHGDAQFMLADIYLTVKLGTPDEVAGVKWLSKAADNGHPRAMSMMGVRYLNGAGVEESVEKAVEMLDAAAQAKNIKAQLLMGFLYFHGKGVEQSDDVASRYYYAAAMNGDEEASTRLVALAERGSAESLTYAGLLYKDGVGVGTDAPKAAEMVLRGAEQNFPLAQYMISHAYGAGQGFEQDYLKAHMWANLAAANGHPDAEKRRDVWSQLMTPEQIAEAQDMAREWTKKFEAAQDGE